MRKFVAFLSIMLGLLSTASLWVGANPPVHHHRYHHKVVRRVVAHVDKSVTVWVNLDSGIYHYPGERWYGNTNNGEYLKEDVAIKDGYRATENGQ